MRRNSASEATANSAFYGKFPRLGAGSALAGLMHLIDRAKQRDDLSGLSEEHLADIGVTRAEMEREAGKWFWE